jgi:hypothetical protein
VVSRGDESLLAIPGRNCSHFPQGEGGEYAGFYPDKSSDCIEHLQRLKDQADTYIVFPEPFFWWLEYYEEFRRYLDEEHELILAGSALARIYRFK